MRLALRWPHSNPATKGSVMPIADDLTALVDDLRKDDEKFEKGNHSAGIRARKTMQKIKRACAERKKTMMEKMATMTAE